MAVSLQSFLGDVDGAGRDAPFIQSVIEWLGGHGIAAVQDLVGLDVGDLASGALENPGLKRGFVRRGSRRRGVARAGSHSA